jgi:drug/metabolite transporter (DMT)-like permease
VPTRRWLPLAAVAVTLLLWASAFVAIRHLGSSFSPGALSLGRLVVGALALGAVMLVRGGRRPTRSDWPRLVAVGVLWYGIYSVAVIGGEQRIDAGTAALLIQLSPVLVAVLAAVFLRERATVWLGIGLVLAFCGVLLIALATSPGGHYDPLGVLLCLLSAAVYSVAIIVQKPLMSRLPAIEVTALACTVGAVVCLPFVGQLVSQAKEASAADLSWVVYLGLFPTAVAFTTYAYALAHMDVGRLSVTTYLVPPLTVLMAWVLLGETPPDAAYAGGLLCLVGVWVARRRTPAKAPAVEEGAPV